MVCCADRLNPSASEVELFKQPWAIHMASFCILYYPYSRTLMDLREVSESIHQKLQFVWAGREERQSFFKLKCAFKGPRYTPDVKGGVKSGQYTLTDCPVF